MSNPDQRRAGFLAEMGLGPLWISRTQPAQESSGDMHDAVRSAATAMNTVQAALAGTSAATPLSMPTMVDTAAGTVPASAAAATTAVPASEPARSAVAEMTHAPAVVQPAAASDPAGQVTLAGEVAAAPMAISDTDNGVLTGAAASTNAELAWPDSPIDSAWDNAVVMPTRSAANGGTLNGADMRHRAGGEKTAEPAVLSAFDDAFADQAEPVPREDGAVPGPSASEIAAMDWDALQAAVASCTKCGLCKSRNKTVFGAGDRKARWLFVGEGPGRNEDLQGEPFVGPAGKLLDNMLIAMGLRRGENAYIANIVKCRPTGADGRDRPPEQEEAAACMPYLERQITLLQPTLIVALGKTAAVSLLDLPAATTLSGLRGKMHRRRGLPMVATFHPAYLLRKLADKAKSWSDLCMAMAGFAAAGNGSAAETGTDSSLFGTGADDEHR